MDLILWRHADADYDAPTDQARKLSPKGRKQAEKMARWLHEQLSGCTPKLIASGAVRTQETLSAFSREFTADPRLNCGARAADYLTVAGWPGGQDEVVILVGHQPEIGEVASLLLHGREEACAFKKGAVWWFRQEDEQHGYLKAVVTPDML